MLSSLLVPGAGLSEFLVYRTGGDVEASSLGSYLTPWTLARVAGFTLLLYDYGLTFSDELETIWRTPKGWFTVYWSILRYLPLVLWPVSLSYIPRNYTLSACQALTSFSLVVASTMVFVANLSFLMRVYALYTRSFLVTAIPLAFSIAHLGLGVAAAVIASRSPMVGGFCMPVDKAILLRMAIIVALVFDTIVVSLVLARCFRLSRQHQNLELIRPIARDGLGYFGVITLLNVIVVISVHKTALRSVLGPAVVELSYLIPSVVACRMILNLRGSAEASLPTSAQSQSEQYAEGVLSAPPSTFRISDANTIALQSLGLRSPRRLW